jgi:tetratricopeptide (TPR) repeat protein
VNVGPTTPWKLRGGLALLVVAIIAAYANSFHGPFIFDDVPSIVSNRSVRHLGSWQVLAAPPDAVTTTGRPLVNLSLAINYAIGGLAVEGYHVVNLVLHILAALALFGLVRRTLLLPALSARFAEGSTGLALAAALLWALHPLQTESVTYVVQRAESIVGLFYLLTLYGLARGAGSTRGQPWHAVAAVACVLGMASKEVMVSAPIVALAYHRIFMASSLRESLRRRWGVWLAMAASWVLLVVVYHLSQNRGGSAGFGLGMTPWQYLRTQFGCMVHYLRLVFWPSPLVLDYGYPVANSAAEIVPYAIVVLVLAALTAVALARQPKWGFLGLSFFAILAPSSSIIPLVGQTKAEHRMYLPLAAVVTLIVLAAYVGLGRLRAGRVSVALVSIVAAALAWGTFRRNKDYQSEITLWDITIANCPSNDRAYHSRGSAYAVKGQFATALPDFDKALALNPRYVKAYSGRGVALAGLGRYEEAIRDHSRAIRLKPESADAYNSRGSAYGNLGQFDAAINDLDKAISLDPYFDEAYYNRGTAYESKGQLDVAIKDFDKAITLWPEYALAYLSRGMIYDNQGQYELAIKDYDQAIRLRPGYAEAYNNRGSAYLAQGKMDVAIKDFDKAIDLQPAGAQGYSNRGNIHMSRGQIELAIKDYDKAIELKPDLAAAYQNRAVARLQIKAYDLAWADVNMLRSLGVTPSPGFIQDLTKLSGRSE